MKNLIYLAIIYLYFDKFLYNIPVLNYNTKNEIPYFWKLDDKNITNTFTLTFYFKSTENIPDHPIYLIFLGYNNLEVNTIKTIHDQNSNNYYININGNNYKNWIIEENLYYYISWEIKKVDILVDSYKINMKLTQGNYYNSYEQNHIKIDKYNFDFNKLFIAFGLKHILERKVYTNCTIENIKLYNRALSSQELDGIKLGGSEALVFWDFSDSLAYSYFHNKVNNGFLGGINGSNINSDSNDIFSEYVKTTNIKKKFYLFDNKSYIKLSQEVIKYWHRFSIQNYLVYLKLSIHLNYSSISKIVDLDYNLYNRENKSGIKIKLIKLKENSLKFFEIKVGFIESPNSYNYIANKEILNFSYLILSYDTYKNNKIPVNLKIQQDGSISKELEIEISKSIFLSTDNHYIGNTSWSNTSYNTNFILIEIEEFMLGKGYFMIKNLTNLNIYYDDIVWYCNNLTNNKIKRINLNSCNQRLDTIPINSDNCELEDNLGNCIFKYPDVNEVVNSNSVNIFKPYRQVFNQFPNNYSNNNKSSINSKVDVAYTSNFTINNNLLIEITIDVTNNLYGNIFEIKFNGNVYSKFVINKNTIEQIFCLEIENSTSITNPSIKIINLSSANTFIIKFIALIEINYVNIVPRTKKFIGEKINNYNEINNKGYALDSNIKNNYRILDRFLIKCFEGCETCNGPLNTDYQTCQNNYLIFKSNGCTKIYAKNCKSYSNPYYCTECINNSSTKFIQKIASKWPNHNNCFECHSSCQIVDPICNNCSYTCLTCNLEQDNDNNCIHCPLYCFKCSFENRMCEGDLKSDCNICKNIGNDKYKKNPIYPFECINCNKIGIINKYTRIETCENCHENCKNCYDKNQNSCFECYDKNILTENLGCIPIKINSKCLPTYVLSLKNINNPYNQFDKCLKCNNNCYDCILSNLSYCISCNKGKYLYNNKCLSSCNNDGQFLSQELDSNYQRICRNCHISCKNCNSVEINGCIECFTGKYLKITIENKYICSSTCEDGYYKEGFYCKKCNENCLNCIPRYPNICTSCKNNSYLEINKCVSKCKEGTYNNINNNICSNCNNECKTCNGPLNINCLKCKNVSLFVNNITNRCEWCNNSNNMVLNEKCYFCDNLINIFLKKECLKCNRIKFNNCKKCNKNKYFLEINNICYSSCPKNTYGIKINNFNYCKNCYLGCEKCTDNKYDSCLSCINYYYYNKSTKQCKNNCDIGYFEKDHKNCKICESKCLKCNKNICNFSCEISKYINFMNNINWDLDWSIYEKYSFYEKILKTKYFIIIKYIEESHNEFVKNKDLFKFQVNKNAYLEFNLFLDLKFKVILIIPLINDNLFWIIKNILIYIDLNLYFKVKKCNIVNNIIFAKNDINKEIDFKSDFIKNIEKKYPKWNENTKEYKNIEITSKITKNTSDILLYSTIILSFFNSSFLSDVSIYLPTLLYFKYLFLLKINLGKNINTIANFFYFNSRTINIWKYINLNKKYLEIRLQKQISYNPKLLNISIIYINFFTIKYIFLNILVIIFCLLKIFKIISLYIFKKYIDFKLNTIKLNIENDINRIGNWDKKFKYKLKYFKINRFFQKIETLIFKYIINFLNVEISNIIFITIIYLISWNYNFLQFKEIIINLLIIYNLVLINFFIYYIKKIINLNENNIKNDLTKILIPFTLKNKFSWLFYLKIIEIIRNIITLIIILSLNYNVILQISILIILQGWYTIFIFKSLENNLTIVLLIIKEVFLCLFLIMNLWSLFSLYNIYLEYILIIIVILLMFLSLFEFIVNILNKYYQFIKRIIYYIKSKFFKKNKVIDFRLKNN